MKYLVDNETVDKTLKEIGLKPVIKDGSYAQLYKALFSPNGWDYLYRGRGYIKNFDEVREKFMSKEMQDKTRHLPAKNVSIYDIPFSFMMSHHKAGTKRPKTYGPRDIRPILNHYPNTPCITNKANLLRTLVPTEFRDPVGLRKPLVSMDLRSYPDAFRTLVPMPKHLDFLPLTFNLSKDNDVKAFEEYLLTPEGKTKFWIYKPEYMYAGRGIQLVSPGPETAGITSLKNGIIQEYLMNPRTVGSSSGGPRKIDYRVMAMMVGVNPTVFFISPLTFIRTSSYPFVKSFSIPNPEYVHITNQSFQKNSTDFGKYEEGNTLIGEIEPGFKTIVKHVFNASLKNGEIMKGYKPNRFRQFEIFGFDFLVLDDGSIKLLEVNDNAGMEWNNKEADQLGKDMIEEAVLLSLSILEGGSVSGSRLWIRI